MSFLFLYRGNENWLSVDRKVLDHDFPRYADPIVFYFAVRYVNLYTVQFFSLSFILSGKVHQYVIENIKIIRLKDLYFFLTGFMYRV